MKQNYYFNGSRNDTVQNPSWSFLREIIFEKNPIYWNDINSSGDSAIYFENEEDNMLIFFNKEAHGFCFFNLDYEVPLKFTDNMIDTNVISHNIGGVPMMVPSICFRNKEESFVIVEYFIKYKSKSPDFKWVNLFDINSGQ